MQKKMKKVVSLAKRRGFVFQSSEIYGGLGSVWDFGPTGSLVKKNIKDQWWQSYVQKRTDIEGLDAAILMDPQVWKASGHLDGFVDPLTECKDCHQRFRADHLIESEGEIEEELPEGNLEKLNKYLEGIKCPECGGELMDLKQFNIMFKTFIGPLEDGAHTAYLRPETAQGIFVNFKKVQQSSRQKLPFGIAQTGKAFRNEITRGNFIFRTREFEQMEIEWFCKPPEVAQSQNGKTPNEWFDFWRKERLNWYKNLGLSEENLRLREHKEDELAHYAKEAQDIEFRYPFGWDELEGVANRTNYDLKQHSEYSNKDLRIFDQKREEKYFPHIIEPSVGIGRAFLAFLLDAFEEEQLENDKTRTVLKFHPEIAPYKVAILPLVNNKEKLMEKARAIHSDVNQNYMSIFDDSGSIGKKYRRQDEIGTPIAATVDFETLEDNTVTLRDRDSMDQIRIKVKNLNTTIKKIIEGEEFLSLGEKVE